MNSRKHFLLNAIGLAMLAQGARLDNNDQASGGVLGTTSTSTTL